MDAATLREFEQRFLSQRTQAANAESWEAYRKDMLPKGLDARTENAINQGFDAGFDAAMNRVRLLLYTMQAAANRAAVTDLLPPEEPRRFDHEYRVHCARPGCLLPRDHYGDHVRENS